MKYGLALSGGGFKGAIQVGAVKEILPYLPNGRFDYVTGISTGALNGSFIAAGKIDKLEQMWKSVKDSAGGNITNNGLGKLEAGKLKIDFSAVIKELTTTVNLWDKASALFSKKGKTNLTQEIMEEALNIDSLLDNSPLYNLLLENIELEDYKDTTYGMGLTSLYTGEEGKYLTSDFFDKINLCKAILASSTMPVIWPPVKEIYTKKGRILNLVDGGITTISPIGQIFDQVPVDEEVTIFILNCNSQQLEIDQRPMHMVNAGGRSLDILLNSVFKKDIKITMDRNKNPAFKQATLILVEPKVGDAGATLDATPSQIDYRLELGKSLAQTALLAWQHKP